MKQAPSNLAEFSTNEDLKRLLLDRDDSFWELLAKNSESADTFSKLFFLLTLRKRAAKLDFANPKAPQSDSLKIAIVGGSTLYPLSDFVLHLVECTTPVVEVKTGDFNNFRSEILDSASWLNQFEPDFVIILPDEQSCKYTGLLTDPAEDIAFAAERLGSDLLKYCSELNANTGAEIILCNYMLPSYIDLGPYRTKSLASDWNFKKLVNLKLGKSAPNFVQLCDLEFLAYRLGGLNCRDEKSWFESKQPCSPQMLVDMSRELAHLIENLKKSPKKVLVLDLDNTLWGGVIGDDGIAGIEIGDTSPRGEAFKAFQSYVLSLTARGVVLGVCSKNDFENAVEPFRKHPEMVLKEENIVSFKANWNPKAQNIIEMAEELDLGLESFVFVDDNPAEIEMVRQFAPDVTTILLDPDPSYFVRQLKESRLFERFSITDEDGERTKQYQNESRRKSFLSKSVDMDSYLRSLEMIGSFKGFDLLDLPRIAQLINKSNQFNLTTKRMTESEIGQLMTDPDYFGFTMRLADRFGDHGLISIVICHFLESGSLEIDSWVMSCRVLKRQVEEAVLNEVIAVAMEKGCSKIKGVYYPTAKNSMVKDLYASLGFRPVFADETRKEYEMALDGFTPIHTYISINSRSV